MAIEYSKKRLPVKRTIRQSQLISPWGIGQMINFPYEDESLMTAGLDAWEKSYNQAVNGKNEFIIREARLERRLNVNHFRLPPDYRKNSPGILNPQLTVPFIRFPRWHYCHRCGSMEFLSIYQPRGQRCRGLNFGQDRSCSKIPDYKRAILMPIRFVAICPDGHIEDFPFIEWVHKKEPQTETCNLRYLIRKSSSALGAIRIVCSCGQYNTMSHSFDRDALTKVNKRCNGEKPWLGEIEDKARGCGNELQTVQRGAANVYFPDIRSSIFIPNADNSRNENIENVLDRFWDLLTSGIIEGQSLDENRFKIVAEMNKDITYEDLYNAALRRLEEQSRNSSEVEEESEELYRKFEFDAFHAYSNKEDKDFLIKQKSNSKYNSFIQTYISNIALAHKLKETRVLVGFSRLIPESTKTLQEEKSDLSLGGNINWLPAIQVRGEGIFLEINKELLAEWEKKPEVLERANLLIGNYNRSRLGYRLPERQLNPRFIMIHTLSHVLINQLSLQCGYGSSSLRERIYCNVENPEFNMNGILIFTASGDSEGSMGGLVNQGNPGRFEEIIMSGLREATWCSSDPICIESNGQGPGSCNLAACHNCTVLPETSCEEGNRLLDRGLLIGTITNTSVGFFDRTTLTK